MLEGHQHGHDARAFDGIVDNRSQHIPKAFTILFYGLVIWAALFCGYYLFSGWSSQGEFQTKMAAHQQIAGESR